MTATWKAETEKVPDSQKLKERLDQARSEVEVAERRGDLRARPELLYGVIPQLQREIEGGQEGGKLVNEAVTEEQIAGVVARWTGVPMERMLEGEADKLLQMEDELRRRVIGQDDALRAVADAIRRVARRA